jgi:hypothetical protein
MFSLAITGVSTSLITSVLYWQKSKCLDGLAKMFSIDRGPNTRFEAGSVYHVDGRQYNYC